MQKIKKLVTQGVSDVVKQMGKTATDVANMVVMNTANKQQESLISQSYSFISSGESIADLEVGNSNSNLSKPLMREET